MNDEKYKLTNIIIILYSYSIFRTLFYLKVLILAKKILKVYHKLFCISEIILRKVNLTNY